MDKKLLCYTIAGIVFTSILGTVSHFVYEWSGGNWLAGLFTPVSESTWEHMKLLFFPMLFYGFFMQFCLKKDYPCISFAYPLGILAGTLAIPVLFYTYTGIVGRNYTVADILIFYLSVIFAFTVVYILSQCAKTGNSLLPMLLVLVIAACFFLFTFFPPKLGVFMPPTSGSNSPQ
ncbi:DUF6512 family protein [Lachnospiraceae bacterium 45-W7]